MHTRVAFPGVQLWYLKFYNNKFYNNQEFIRLSNNLYYSTMVEKIDKEKPKKEENPIWESLKDLNLDN